MAKRRIAILGGGWGSISTALYLTDPANPHRDDYEITIYERGWRLGGKCVSGRGPYGRNQEHGLHVLMGFYENTFRVLRQVYDEVQPIYRRITDYDRMPFKSWQDAFKPHDYIVLADSYNHRWTTWGFELPRNDAVPGDHDGVLLSPWDYVSMLLEWLVGFHGASEAADRPGESGERAGLMGDLQALWDFVTDSIQNAAHGVLVAAWQRFAAMADRDPAVLEAIAAAMDRFVIALLRETRELVADNDRLRRDVTLMELGAVMVKGLIADGIIEHPDGLDALDDEDARHWLHRHGASGDLLDSAFLRGSYDLVLAYANGEVNRPDYAAGVAIRAMTRIALTYRGAVFWKMQAGMSDTVFAPPYLVLRERGVKFRFFHAVEDLHLDAAGERVESIDIGVQATPKEADGEYWPLVNVENLPCWPAEPNYDQLAQGESLKQRGIDLESVYTEWTPVERRRLKRGTDFDDVVLGIPVGAFPYMARELMDANPRFRAMVENLGTVRTMSVQFWFDRNLAAMGWDQPSPVMAAYSPPLNTWADMTQLIPRESYPPGSVGNIAYLTGPMVGGIAPPEDHDAPARAHERVRQAARTFLQSLSGFLWPDAAAESAEGYPLNTHGTAFERLVAPDAPDATAAFDAQFFRANIDPAQRYVQSRSGTTTYRLRPWESGFANLVLAGDWTRNGFNAGGVEPTTWSGIQASNTLSGYPALSTIVGYDVPTTDKYGRT